MISRFKSWFLGIMFALGIALTCNEGSWYWINWIGIALIGIVGMAASYPEGG